MAMSSSLWGHKTDQAFTRAQKEKRMPAATD